MLLEVVDLILAREGHIACRGDDLDLGGEDLERQVETHLVVTGTRRAVSHGIGADLLGVLDDGDGLEDTLRAYRDGVGAVTQDVTIDHVTDRLLVILLLDVERGVLHGTQLDGALLDLRQLLRREAARVGNGRIDIVTLLLAQVLYAERGIQTAAKGENYFLFHRFISFLFYFKWKIFLNALQR